MVKSKSDTIVLLGDPVRREVVAAGAIEPGHLIQIGSAGTAVVQATADAIVRKAVAIENEAIGGDIDTAYASGDVVQYVICRPGDRVRLKVVTEGAAIVIGDKLSSGVLGGVKKGTANVVAFALEAVDNSANAVTQVWIDAEIA